jgi:hypothetical protein
MTKNQEIGFRSMALTFGSAAREATAAEMQACREAWAEDDAERMFAHQH